jgi:cell division protein FtsQ
MNPQSRSWRDIPQQVKPRAMSPEGRRRAVFGGIKTVLAIVTIGGLTWGGFEIAATLRGKPRQLSSAAEAVPVKEIDFTTDGVLDKNWAVQTLALPRNASLVQLDIYQLRSRLLASAQVRTATLTRTYPSTLTVTISEQSPVARVMAQRGEEQPHLFLVARDGTVFEGIGFDNEMLSTLPWLDGVKLTRTDNGVGTSLRDVRGRPGEASGPAGEGFEPIRNMEVAAELLAKAKLEAEHLYRTWQVISLARLQSDGEIEIRSQTVQRIVFGTTEDFFRQLARLDLLLDKSREKTDKPPREINLAIGAQVPVTFDDPALAPTITKPTSTRAAFRLGTASPFPNPQRNTKL